MTEYGAVVLLVAALASAVFAASVPGQVRDLYISGLCKIGNADPEECADADPGSDPQQADPTEETPWDVPAPEERVPDTGSEWPYTVTPVSNEPGDGGGGDDEEPVTSGTLSEEESPLYTDPGTSPQHTEYEASQDDYESLGEGERVFCSPFLDPMCCPGNTCVTITDVESTVQATRVACFFASESNYCRSNAADYFEHFLTGSGDDMTVDLDTFREEVPEFQEEIDQRQEELIEDALIEAEEREIDGPLTIPISTENQSWGYVPGQENIEFAYDNPDWQYAIGSFHYWMDGEITVYPPDEPGGDYSYEMDTSVEMEKWYDWERDSTDPVFDDWKQNIAGYSEADLAELHQYGMAQEFWVRGRTDLPTEEG